MAPNFTPGEHIKDFLRYHCKVLVIGAGSLGCEILKNLVMSGFRHFDIIDMDTIQMSDLPTHSLFRISDIGKSKSRIAANYITQRFPDASVNIHECPIELMHLTFFESFTIIICSANNPCALTWINQQVLLLVQQDHQKNIIEKTVVPLIIGKTNCCQGEVRVLFPHKSCCYKCLGISAYDRSCLRNADALEDRITYAVRVLWDRFQTEKFDPENRDHVARVVELCRSHYRVAPTAGLISKRFKTMNVNFASTNAIVASYCTNEALKLVTDFSTQKYNYFDYDGTNSVITLTKNISKDKNKYFCRECTCSHICTRLTVNPDMTVGEWRDTVNVIDTCGQRNLTIRYHGKSVYVPSSKYLEQKTRRNLPMKMIDVIPDHTRVRLTNRFFLHVKVADVIINYNHYGFLEVSLRGSFSDVVILCSNHGWA
jgi:ubiquitin-activating enzyme E1 C